MSEWLHTDWYREQRAELDDTPRTGLLLAGQVYGAHYLDMFDDYCVSSMLAPANREALVANNALVEMYTNADSFDMLEAHMQRLKDVGIDTSIRLIPDELFQPGYTWLLLGATHTLSGQHAARTGMDFHMLMPDQAYSVNFFPNLFRLADQHGCVTQTALNMDGAGMPALTKFFRLDGTLEAPALDLADIAWEYLHERMAVQIANNAVIPDYMPNTHYHLWRARDRVLLFSACSNPIFVTSEVCQKFESNDPTTSTLDIWPQALFDTDFYSPSPEDDMAVIGIEPGGAWAGPTKELFAAVDDEAFAANYWSWIGNRDDHLIYYEKPVLDLAASPYDGVPSVEEVFERQQEFVHVLKMKKREA